MYFLIVIGLLAGFSYLSAIGAYLAGYAWVLICGLVAFVVAKIDSERWAKLDGRS